MSRERGVTLMEMLVVMTLLSLMAGITYPSVSAGLETLRVNSAADRVVSFVNSALDRAERRLEVIELSVTPTTLSLRSTEPGFARELRLDGGVTVARVLPGPPVEEPWPRRFYLYPGGAPPRIAFLLRNARGVSRLVRVDPITGVPRIEIPEEEAR
jgi:prepilin-type N-terminal cleavage/methylation domain-containing protein